MRSVPLGSKSTRRCQIGPGTQRTGRQQNWRQKEAQPRRKWRAASALSKEERPSQSPQVLNFVQLPGEKCLSLKLDTETRQRLPVQYARFPLDETRSTRNELAENRKSNPPP